MGDHYSYNDPPLPEIQSCCTFSPDCWRTPSASSHRCQICYLLPSQGSPLQ